MAFVRPTLAELAERIQQDAVSRLALVAPILRRSLTFILARVVAGASHMLHGHLDFLARQIFPDRSERAFLIRWGSLFGITMNAAEFATGTAIVVGTNGTAVPAGTVFLRADGTAYELDAEVTIAALAAWAGTTAYALGALKTNGGNVYLCTVAGVSAGSGGPLGTGADIVDGAAHWRYVGAGTAAAYSTVTAKVAGQDGNCSTGTALAFESPVAGANATAVVSTDGLSGGTDEEEIEPFRARVLERMRNPPHGGNAADYVRWAKERAGVTRAWCYPLEGGAGTVTIRFVRDNDEDGLIPDAGEVEAVRAHIDGVIPHTGLAPATAIVTVAAPIADPLDPKISITPDTIATRAAVKAELADLHHRTAAPGGTTLLSQLRTAVGNSEGVTDYAIASPVADVVHAVGHMGTLGTIDWS